MKYYVRTTGERVLDNSFSQIKYELWIDYEHKPTKAFIELLEKVQNENVVLMEDDIILCKDFDTRINEVIEKNPNEIINFFTRPNKYIKDFKVNYKNFCYNQCTYFPSNRTKEILQYVKEHEEVKEQRTPEPFLKEVFKGLNLITLTHRPCLVQHIDDGSLMNHHSDKTPRRTPYFIDYLDKLNVKYEDCENHNVLIELKYALRSHFIKLTNVK